ncbi:MAG: class F sortase, partial [Acidimicrobiales bacterium]
AVLASSVVLEQRGLFTPDRPPDTVVEATGSQEVVTAALQAPDPTAVRIPALDVNASTTPLGIRDDGKIEVPQDYQQTGWWRDGPEPGEVGPAVILGHVDSYEGPAVFYGLETLSVGESIHIDRVDGSTVTFVVERIEQHPKDDFPTLDVYGPTDESELRLVTCGGSFDREARSYRDNVIVFAVAA